MLIPEPARDFDLIHGLNSWGFMKTLQRNFGISMFREAQIICWRFFRGYMQFGDDVWKVKVSTIQRSRSLLNGSQWA